MRGGGRSFGTGDGQAWVAYDIEVGVGIGSNNQSDSHMCTIPVESHSKSSCCGTLCTSGTKLPATEFL